LRPQSRLNVIFYNVQLSVGYLTRQKFIFTEISSCKKRDTCYTENLFPFSFDVETNHSDLYPS